MSNRKIFLQGVLLWIVPFLVSLPLVTREGEPRVDPFLFKSILLLVGLTTGLLLMRRALASVRTGHRGVGLRAAVLWTSTQWALDATILLPISGLSLRDYVYQIGLRYLAIAVQCWILGRVAEDAARR